MDEHPQSAPRRAMRPSVPPFSTPTGVLHGGRAVRSGSRPFFTPFVPVQSAVEPVSPPPAGGEGVPSEAGQEELLSERMWSQVAADPARPHDVDSSRAPDGDASPAPDGDASLAPDGDASLAPDGDASLAPDGDASLALGGDVSSSAGCEASLQAHEDAALHRDVEAWLPRVVGAPFHADVDGSLSDDVAAVRSEDPDSWLPSAVEPAAAFAAEPDELPAPAIVTEPVEASAEAEAAEERFPSLEEYSELVGGAVTLPDIRAVVAPAVDETPDSWEPVPDSPLLPQIVGQAAANDAEAVAEIIQRVAERVRRGELALPVAGAEGEASALAIALAAILQPGRR